MPAMTINQRTPRDNEVVGRCDEVGKWNRARSRQLPGHLLSLSSPSGSLVLQAKVEHSLIWEKVKYHQLRSFIVVSRNSKDGPKREA